MGTRFPDHMVAADFDGDGHDDVAITDHGGIGDHDVRDPTLAVYRGSRTGLMMMPALFVSLSDFAP
jgi:hypothetical protein